MTYHAGKIGSILGASRAAHTHQINTPNSIGTSTTASRADHTHISPSVFAIQILEQIAKNPEIQKLMINNFGDLNSQGRKFLVFNQDLIPELFSDLFLEFKKEIIDQIKYSNFSYRNPETQALLEKALLLL